MKLRATLIACLAGITMLAALPLSADKTELPEITEDGLHLLEDSKLAIVYVEPGASLAGYNGVKLLDAYVAFKKNWMRDQRKNSANPLSVTTNDVEKIKDNLAKEFQAVFVEALQDAGYRVTDEAAEDVLLVRPAIINLDVTAPDTAKAGRSYSMTSSAGEMTLYLELYDSVTGDLIAKAMDRKVDNPTRNGYYTWTNSVTNRQAAMRILKGWSEILVDALNEAHEAAKTP